MDNFVCKKRLFTILPALLLNIGLVFAQYTSLPYFCGFENPNDTIGWNFKLRPRTTGFAVGDAAHCLGRNSMYISPDSGATATYGITSSGYVSLAYVSLTLPAGDYTLAFDYQCGGDGANQDMKVAFVPSAVALSASSVGSSYPTEINLYQFADINTDVTFGRSAWRHVTGNVNVQTAGTYQLCFAFRCNSQTVMPHGACIDNIQLDTVKSLTDCTCVPYDINVVKDFLGNVIVSWNGNAAEYQVLAAQNTDPGNYSFVRHAHVTSTTDTLRYSELGEGRFFIFIRAICGQDTSIYAENGDVLLYDLSTHCIDFVDFSAPGTRCTYGSYDIPYQTDGYINNGPSQMSSRHTVHTDLNETDPRTGGGLATIPPDELLSVRLGNWNSGSEGESITYSYNVPDGANTILLMKYAIVFEEPGHAEPPEFQLEIFDENNVYLDNVCTKIDFLCDGTLTQGWHEYSDTTDIWWKEWSTIGVNLSDYAGSIVKIRLTTRDCNWSGHFGYAYFTLDCVPATITGVLCSTTETRELSAPDGFTYRWTNNCTGQIISTQQSLPLAGVDSCSYSCVCANKERPSCSFTLNAYLFPHLPEASFTYSLVSSDCNSYISFNNKSKIFVIQDGQKIYLPTENPTSMHWVIRSQHTDRPYHNMTSDSLNFDVLQIPAEGDTLEVTLTAWLDNCDHDTTITISIPRYQDLDPTIVRAVIFQGETYQWNGNTYSEPGEYNMTYVSDHGCDSVVTLHLSVIDNTETDIVDYVHAELVPNPARQGETVLVYGDFGEVKSVEILNAAGALICKYTPDTSPVEVQSSVPSGCYYVRLTTAKGEMFVRKLIVR